MPPLSGLLPCFILLSFFLSRFCSAKILFGEADLFRQRVAPGAAQLQTSSPPHRFSPSLAALLCIPKRSFSSPAHSVSSSSRPSSSSSARLRASSSSSSALRTSSSASSHSSLSSLSSPLNRPLFSRCPCGTANEEGASLLCIRAAGLSSAEPPPRGFSLSNACASVPAFLSLSHLSLLSEVSRACLSTAQRPFRSSLHATRRRAASESPGVAACALFWASVGIPRSALRGLSGWAAWRVARAETAAERLLPSSTKVHMVWGYPIFGDDPKKLRRKKVDHAWERGLSRANLAWEYETANKLAQGIYYIKEEHSIHSMEEEGLGSTDDMMLTAEQAAGNVEIDPEEIEKIKRVLPIVDRGDGVGIATLIGAKDGMFAFRYNGPLTHKFGFKQWLRYLITANYPGAKVRLVTEHSIDPEDRPGNQKHRLPEEMVAQIRKVVFWRRPYQYENEQEAYGPNPLGHVSSPQQIR